MRNPASILFLVLLAAACGKPKPQAPAGDARQAQARQWLMQGEYQRAYDAYQQLAELQPRRADFYRLRAAEALIAMNRADDGVVLLSSVAPQEAAAVALKTLLQAWLALRDNQPEQTLALLEAEFAGKAPAAFQARRLRLRALAWERQGDFVNAVRARLAYNDYLERPADAEANALKTWQSVGRIDRDVQRQLRDANPQALGGWLELAFIHRTLAADYPALRRALDDWRERRPAHPANASIVGQLLAASKLYSARPRQLALLLPFSGAYAKAAAAIRDGFLSAWYAAPGDKPLVKLYDANPENARQVYQQAVADGAEFVVGPLEKQAIAKLATLPEPAVPTLALNQAPGVGGAADGAAPSSAFPRLIQFGLSPEDEARQAARRAYGDGHVRALVIVPNDQWGQRLHRAFQEAWQRLGGTVLEQVAYNPQGGDYSLPVKQLLNLDDSEGRAARLRRTLNRSLSSAPRRRQDADMIFMAAFPVAARRLAPQFRFHHAEDIPMYATSHVFTGKVNPRADADLNNILFVDMPWLLEARENVSPVASLVETHFAAADSPYQRLYALGVDAFHLAPRLPRLVFEEDADFLGVTGRLTLSRDGRIRRAPAWARIVDGRPQLLAAP